MNRAKAEKSRQTMSREIEDLGEKLQESGNATQTAMEINKKREAELMKLKQDLDEANLQVKLRTCMYPRITCTYMYPTQSCGVFLTFFNNEKMIFFAFSVK